MSSYQNLEKKIEREYHVSWYIIVYKAVFGLIEFLSGVGLAIFGKQMLHFYNVILADELSEEPHDLLARLSERIIPNLLTHDTFLAIYLLLLGAVKIAGAAGLIYKKNWGVDLLVAMTIVLFPFQIVNLLIHPSLFDFIYISFGILIALYLVEFKPKAWISKVLLNIKG